MRRNGSTGPPAFQSKSRPRSDDTVAPGRAEALPKDAWKNIPLNPPFMRKPCQEGGLGAPFLADLFIGRAFIRTRCAEHRSAVHGRVRQWALLSSNRASTLGGASELSGDVAVEEHGLEQIAMGS